MIHILMCSRRSGSNYLCDLLYQAADIHMLNYFGHSMISKYDKCVDKEAYPNYNMFIGNKYKDKGELEIKCHYDHFYRLCDFLDEASISNDEVNWIWLTRTNKMLQAISCIKSSGNSTEDIEEKPFSCDHQDIKDKLADISIAESIISNFFTSNYIEPQRIFYEDMIRYSYIETIKKALIFLGITYNEAKLNAIEPRYKKLSGIYTEKHYQSFVERYK